MGRYSIEFRKGVEKELKKIPERDQIRILRRIRTLSDDPRPPNSTKLSNQERYRIRQGDYRIVYEIQDARLIVVIVVIVRVRHRREVYN